MSNLRSTHPLPPRISFPAERAGAVFPGSVLELAAECHGDTPDPVKLPLEGRQVTTVAWLQQALNVPPTPDRQAALPAAPAELDPLDFAHLVEHLNLGPQAQALLLPVRGLPQAMQVLTETAGLNAFGAVGEARQQAARVLLDHLLQRDDCTGPLGEHAGQTTEEASAWQRLRAEEANLAGTAEALLPAFNTAPASRGVHALFADLVERVGVCKVPTLGLDYWILSHPSAALHRRLEDDVSGRVQARVDAYVKRSGAAASLEGVLQDRMYSVRCTFVGDRTESPATSLVWVLRHYLRTTPEEIAVDVQRALQEDNGAYCASQITSWRVHDAYGELFLGEMARAAVSAGAGRVLDALLTDESRLLASVGSQVLQHIQAHLKTSDTVSWTVAHAVSKRRPEGFRDYSAEWRVCAQLFQRLGGTEALNSLQTPEDHRAILQALSERAGPSLLDPPPERVDAKPAAAQSDPHRRAAALSAVNAALAANDLEALRRSMRTLDPDDYRALDEVLAQTPTPGRAKPCPGALHTGQSMS